MTQLDSDGMFDIFRHHEGGPVWVKAVRGREEAMRLIAKLAAEQPTQVFRLWDPRSGRFMDVPPNSDNLRDATNE